MKTFGAGLFTLLAGYAFASWADSLQAGVFVMMVLGIYILLKGE
jgi:hypothetical protein